MLKVDEATEEVTGQAEKYRDSITCQCALINFK